MFGRIPHQQRLAEAVPGGRTHAQVTLVQRAMDSMGIDYMVVFPTPMLVLGMHPQIEMEVVIGNAFNKWLTEEILPQDPRIKAMLYLPFNHPEESLKAVETYANTPGVIGFSVTSTRFRAVNHDSYMPLYSAIQATGKPLAFHSGFHWGDQSMQQCNRFISMHAISFVYYNLIHLTNWIINGLPERFPKLKVLWIESGLAWVPFLMQRLDSEYMMRSSEAPLLKRRPSEYIADMYFTSQPLERSNLKLTEATFEAIKADTQLLFASDWPHWDFDLPSSITTLPFLSEEAKRNILGLNAARLFNLEVPKHKLIKPAAEQDQTGARAGHGLNGDAHAAQNPKPIKRSGRPAAKPARRTARGFLRGRPRRAQARRAGRDFGQGAAAGAHRRGEGLCRQSGAARPRRGAVRARHRHRDRNGRDRLRLDPRRRPQHVRRGDLVSSPAGNRLTAITTGRMRWRKSQSAN